MKWEGQAEHPRHQVYVPVRAITRVQAMMAERQPVAVAVEQLTGLPEGLASGEERPTETSMTIETSAEP